MPRRARFIVGGYAYHVFNRANGRLGLFRKEADFLAFEQVLGEPSGACRCGSWGSRSWEPLAFCGLAAPKARRPSFGVLSLADGHPLAPLARAPQGDRHGARL